MPLEASTIEPLVKIPPQAGHRSAWRAILSFPVVLAVLLVALTVLTVRSRFSDPDLWYHLKIGEIISNTHSIPRVDLFSFTAYGHPWVAQEWLSQLALYGVYKFGGYTGLMLCLCVLPSLLVIGGYLLCTLYSNNAKVAFLGGLITWFFATVGMAIRPHLIGYTLLICELLILHLGRSRDARWFLALPPLFALWVNTHGSFFFGLVILAIVLFCSFIEVRWGLLISQRWDKRRRNILTIASVLSLAALSVNPIGWKLALNPIEVGKLHVNLTHISEWLPPQFDNIRGLGLLAVTGIIVLVPLLRRAELRLEELFLAALAFGMGALHERMLFVSGILLAPIVCRLLADLWDRYEANRDHPIANAILIAASLFTIVWAFPNVRQLERQIEAANPVKALDYIKRSGLSGRMLNEYVYGGYLIWAAPQYKVFIDGRGDIFELNGVLTEYLKWTAVQTDPKLLVNKYNIKFCLLSRETAVTHALPLLQGWKLVYSDGLASVFARAM